MWLGSIGDAKTPRGREERASEGGCRMVKGGGSSVRRTNGNGTVNRRTANGRTKNDRQNKE